MLNNTRNIINIFYPFLYFFYKAAPGKYTRVKNVVFNHHCTEPKIKFKFRLLMLENAC